MPLPTIATPTYELELPSTKKSVKFRPFLVKEEKLLVLALESEDTKQITTAIKAVLNNCVLSRGIKIEKLPTFDIEFLFLNIRAKSVGEEIELNITAPDDGVTEIPVVIDLDSIRWLRVMIIPNKSNSMTSWWWRMKYPSLDEFIKNNFDFNSSEVGIEKSFELIASCIDKIYNEDEVWTTLMYQRKKSLTSWNKWTLFNSKRLKSSSRQCLNFLILSRSRIQRPKLRVKLYLKGWVVFHAGSHMDLEELRH